ncbi:MAG: hypothetical protein JWO73_942 [Candidatus Taylorbacteria bacterium]|nr:hypothetical protein [Candidatus Taylorbacteria bacterium]
MWGILYLMNPQNNPNEINPNDLFPQRPAYQQTPPSSPAGGIGQQPTPAMTTHKSHLLIKVIIVIILLLIAGGVASAFYLNIFQSPETTVKNTAYSADKLLSAHTEGVIDVSFTQSGKANSFKVTMSTDADKSDAKNPNISSKIAFAGMGLTADADVRYIDNTLYLRVNQFPLSGMIPGTTNIQGVWYSVTKQEIEDYSKQYGSKTPAALQDPKNIPHVSDLYDIFKSSHFIGDITSQGISKGKDGSYVRTYSIPIQKEHLSEALIALVSKYDPTGKSIPNVEEAKKEFDSILNDFTFDTATVEVGLFDQQVRSVAFGIGFNPTGKATIPSFGGGHVGVRSEYSKINQKLSFEKPADAQSLTKLIEASMGQSQQKAQDAMIKSYLMSLRPSSALYFDKNHGTYVGFCGSNDVKNMNDTLAAKQGHSPLNCLSDASKFIAFVPLSDQTYFCVDSAGAAVTIPGIPVSKSCK